MNKRSLLNSFKFAWQGLSYAFRNQRNLRIHIFIAIFVILLGLLLEFKPVEIAILSLTIIFVIVCELMNTAFEISLDFVNGKKFHPSVKLVKDIAAAGVLLASINAVIVGLIIFLKYV